MNLLTPLRARGLALALAIFAIDRAVKWVLTGPMDLPLKGPFRVLPIYAFRYTENYGVSLGMFTADSPQQRWLLVAVTAAIAIGVVVWMLREKAWGEITGLSLILGGAMGNIWDRAVSGFVIDYADLHFGEWRPFLIFNLADAAITFGVLILLARSLLLREKPATSGQSA
jgi:signal peptidase II